MTKIEFQLVSLVYLSITMHFFQYIDTIEQQSIAHSTSCTHKVDIDRLCLIVPIGWLLRHIPCWTFRRCFFDVVQFVGKPNVIAASKPHDIFFCSALSPTQFKCTNCSFKYNAPECNLHSFVQN